MPFSESSPAPPSPRRSLAASSPALYKCVYVIKQTLGTHIHGVVFFTAFNGAIGRQNVSRWSSPSSDPPDFCPASLTHGFARRWRLNMPRQSLRRRVPNADPGRHPPSAPSHIQTVVRRFIRRYASYGSYRIQIKRKAVSPGGLSGRRFAGRVPRHRQKERNFQAAQRHHLILHLTDIPAWVTQLKIAPTCPSLINLANRFFSHS